MTSALSDKPLVDALAAIFYAGCELEDNPHTLPVLRLIRKLRPHSPKLAVVEAQQLIEGNDLQGARQLLEEADERSPDTPIVKAMLALVLQQQRDGLWDAYAQEARKLLPDDRTLSILDSLDRMARGDPFEAEEDDEPTPVSTAPSFVMPYHGVVC